MAAARRTALKLITIDPTGTLFRPAMEGASRVALLVAALLVPVLPASSLELLCHAGPNQPIVINNKDGCLTLRHCMLHGSGPAWRQLEERF